MNYEDVKVGNWYIITGDKGNTGHYFSIGAVVIVKEVSEDIEHILHDDSVYVYSGVEGMHQYISVKDLKEMEEDTND